MNFYFPRKCIRRLPGIVIKAVKLPTPTLWEGFGKRSAVGEICRQKGYRSVLLVTDVTLLSLGFHQAVEKALTDAGISCTVFGNICSEPTYDIVCEGRRAAEACRADCVVALGGGSVLDSSKIIAASAAHPKRAMGYFLQKFVFAKTLPMISVPSTAGTGAEITVGAVVKNKKSVKRSSVVTALDVTDVVLDAELTVGAPENVTFSCGIDALSHGLEGCLADVKVSEEDCNKSRECVRLVMENLPKLKNEPKNVELRQKLCLAAHYGGNAINKQLAGYVHAFAHTLGAYYHVSHGEAIARCLLPIVAYHENICADRLFDLSVYCGFASETDPREEGISKFLDALRALLVTCGFSGGFRGLCEADYPTLVKGINADSINYSPAKTLKNREILQLLNEIKRGAL